MDRQRLLSIFFWMLFFNTSYSQEAVPGRLISRIACRADSAQSYSLYLPSAYDGRKSYPAVVVLDPAARGSLAAGAFRDAAEELGLIIAASNNSRNGPIAAAVESVGKMINDVLERFSIDQIYLSGFSGGARVATQVAMDTRIAGVLACGAAFPNGTPESRLPFAFVGIAGNSDFNYCELRDVQQKLAQNESPSYFIYFNGGHRWPPPDVIREGLLYLLVKNRAVQNPQLVDALEQRLKTKLAGRLTLVDQVLACQSLMEVLPADQSSIWKEKLTEIQSKPAFRKELDSVHANVKNELAYQFRLNEQIQAVIFKDSVRMKPLSWWRAELGSLNKILTGRSRSDTTYVTRQKEFIFSGTFYGGIDSYDLEQYDQAEHLFSVAKIFHSTDPQVYYQHARVFARLAREGEALDQLEKAVQLGFNNRSELQRESAFEKLRKKRRYRAMLN